MIENLEIFFTEPKKFSFPTEMCRRRLEPGFCNQTPFSSEYSDAQTPFSSEYSDANSIQ